ncbi:MAG: BtpA/SgcQ family protein [Defluviitoga tunisiensis]|jgi:membrane complex biogenesis BtpA family protein
MWTKDVFDVEKPVLGMVHFLPLPGTPLYDSDGGIEKIRKFALQDAQNLAKAGFDGLVFSNEGDRPYLSDVSKFDVALISRLIYETSSKIGLPFGVSVLADSEAAFSVAEAVNANFARTFLSWVFVTDWGIVEPQAGKLQRFKAQINGKSKIIANISGHSVPLGERDIGDIAKAAIFFGLADAVCLAGTTAGSPVDEEDIIKSKKKVGESPVFIGTGVNIKNVEKMLNIGDGVIVGTSLKIDGDTFKPIDFEKACSFIKEVKRIRG